MLEVMDFKKGDIIIFHNIELIVVENYGTSGKVKEVGSDRIINNFYWEYGGEKCELKMDMFTENELLNLLEIIDNYDGHIWQGISVTDSGMKIDFKPILIKIKHLGRNNLQIKARANELLEGID